MIPMIDPLSFFSRDYWMARERFRERVARLSLAGWTVDQDAFEVPVEVDEWRGRQPASQALTMDLASLKRGRSGTDRERPLVIVSSGVHGPETYTGSAVQLAILDWLSREAASAVCADIDFYFIHAMNPFGFLMHRRGTSKNVNLNRNFGSGASALSTASTDYDQLVDLFEPAGPVADPNRARLRLIAGLLKQLALWKFDMKRLIQAMAQGQFKYAKGLDYGGQRAEPQTEHLQKVLPDLIAKASSVFLYDLHTGLGDRYTLHLILQPSLDSASLDFKESLLSTPPDSGPSPFAPTDMSAPGFYSTVGDFTDFVNRQTVERGKPCLSTTAEYGTIGADSWSKFDTVARTVLESQGWHQGYHSEDVRKRVEHDFLELFYPAEEKWQRVAVDSGLRTFQRIVSNLAIYG